MSNSNPKKRKSSNQQSNSNKSKRNTNERLQSIMPDTYVASRQKELQTFVEGMNPKLTGLRTFQTLPRHLRRRSMSHNLYRVPVALRERAAREMGDTKSPSDSKKHRRFRRRPKFLVVDHSRRQNDDKRWLETHLWHAKRMHMKQRWGMMLADEAADKGVRALHRAERHMCTVHDASYHLPLELRGPQSHLLALLARFTPPAATATAANQMYLDGHRMAHRILCYEPHCYPLGFIGPVRLLWRSVDDSFASNNTGDVDDDKKDDAVSPSGTNNNNNNNDDDDDDATRHRSVWLFVHAAIYDQLLSCIHTQARDDEFAHTVQVIELRDELLLYQLRGPHSARLLDAALQPLKLNHSAATTCDSASTSTAQQPSSSSSSIHLSPDDLQQAEWSKQRHLRTTASLPNGTVLALKCSDPRIAWPPDKSLDLSSQQAQSNAESVLTRWLDNTASSSTNTTSTTCAIQRSSLLLHSPLWDADQRAQFTSSMDSQRAINRVRSPFTNDDASSLNAPAFPLIFVSFTTENNSQLGSGYDIIVPKGAGMAVWRSLTFAGARATPLAQQRAMAIETDTWYFPFDAVDSEAGKIAMKEEETKRREHWLKRPVRKRVNFEKLGEKSPFACDWAALVEADQSNNNNSSSNNDNNNANASYYILRDRNVLNRVRRGEQLASDAVRGALLLVRVRVVGRGTVDYNAALCAPSTALLSSLAPLSSRSSLLHADTRSQHAAASCAVIGRITSDRAVSLTHGCGAGIGCISLVQWLDLRQRLDSVNNSNITTGLYNQLLLRNVQSTVFRVVTIKVL